MDNLNIIQFTWTDLLVAVVAFFALYFVLKFVSRLLRTTGSPGGFQDSVGTGIHYILLAYEPLVLLITGSIFILINPIFHGLLVILLLIGGLSYLKNYVSGRIIQLDNSLSPGKRLSYQNIKGIITTMGRLGVQLKTGKGLQFIPYTELYSQGFMVLAGSEIGGYYTLKVKPEKVEDASDYITEVMDILVSAPYLDKNHKPEIMFSEANSEHSRVKVLVKEERHVYELIEMVCERGFTASISNI